MTLNDLEWRNGVILRYFSEFWQLPGALRKSSRSLSHLLVSSYNRWESIKGFTNGLGKLSLQYIIKVCKVQFYYHLLYAANPTVSLELIA